MKEIIIFKKIKLKKRPLLASTHSFSATAKPQQKKPLSGIVPETQDSHANSHSTSLIPQGQVTYVGSVFYNI